MPTVPPPAYVEWQFIGVARKTGPDPEPVVLQVSAQITDCHAVEAGRPLVAPDTRQRLLQIAGLDDRLHRRSRPHSQAFGHGARHAGFDPSVSGAPGFTRRRRLQGQFQLDLLPPGPHERAALLTLVHPSGLRRQPDYYALC